MKNKMNLNLVEDESFSRGGIYGLWLRVTCDACDNFINYRTTSAASFLFDRNNQFFDMVADQLEFEPDALRKKIKQAFRQHWRLSGKSSDMDEGMIV